MERSYLTDILTDNTRITSPLSAHPAIPSRSHSRPRITPLEQLVKELRIDTTSGNGDNFDSISPIEPFPVFETSRNVVNQATYAGPERQMSVATHTSHIDSVFDDRNPASSSLTTPQLSKTATPSFGAKSSMPTRLIVEKTHEALVKAAENPLPAVAHDGQTGVRSVFHEHLTPTASDEATPPQEELLAAFLMAPFAGESLIPEHVQHLQEKESADLEASLASLPGQHTPLTRLESRNAYISTWCEREQSRIDVPDARPSTVAERYHQTITDVESELSEDDESQAEVRYGFPASDALHMPGHRYSFSAPRAAPSPPKTRKTRNPFKRFGEKLTEWDTQWEAKQEKKREEKATKMEEKTREAMAKAAKKQVDKEAKESKQQIRRNSRAQALDAKAKVQREMDAHRQKQRRISLQAQQHIEAMKREMAEKEKATKLAKKEQQKQQKLEMLNQKVSKRRPKTGETLTVLGKQGSKRVRFQSQICGTLGLYGKDVRTPEEVEQQRLAQAKRFEQQVEAAHQRYLQRQFERSGQLAGGVDPEAQTMAWWERERGSTTNAVGPAGEVAGYGETTSESGEQIIF